MLHYGEKVKLLEWAIAYDPELALYLSPDTEYTVLSFSFSLPDVAAPETKIALAEVPDMLFLERHFQRV